MDKKSIMNKLNAIENELIFSTDKFIADVKETLTECINEIHFLKDDILCLVDDSLSEKTLVKTPFPKEKLRNGLYGATGYYSDELPKSNEELTKFFILIYEDSNEYSMVHENGKVDFLLLGECYGFYNDKGELIEDDKVVRKINFLCEATSFTEAKEIYNKKTSDKFIWIDD